MTTPADTLTTVPAPPATNPDLPPTQYPSIPRIVRSNTVGPVAANQQESALEKRTETLRSAINQLISVANTLDTWFVRRNGSAQSDSVAGITADMPLNGHTVTGLRAGVASGEAARYDELAALISTVTSLYTVPVGAIFAFANNYPTGYLACGGQLYDTTGWSWPNGTHQSYTGGLTWSALNALRAHLGSLYGGDGVTSFRVPNLASRVIMGLGGGTLSVTGGLTPHSAYGEALGEESHALTATEIPAHRHFIAANVNPGMSSTNSDLAANGFVAKQNNQSNNEKYALANTATDATLGQTSSIGLGGAHNVIQPSIVMQFAIRY